MGGYIETNQDHQFDHFVLWQLCISNRKQWQKRQAEVNVLSGHSVIWGCVCSEERSRDVVGKSWSRNGLQLHRVWPPDHVDFAVMTRVCPGSGERYITRHRLAEHY